MIIGISGKIGSGKDTIGAIIQYLVWRKYMSDVQTNFKDFQTMMQEKGIPYHPGGFKIKKFADKLKEIVALLLGIPRTDLEKQEVKDRILGDEWQVYYLHAWNKEIFKTAHTLKEAEEFVNRSNSQHKNTYKKSERTVRWMLQYIGTELMRERLHQNAHINATFADYRTNFEAKDAEEWGKNLEQNWIITDVRFPNEAEAIKERGGIVIRVNRTSAYNGDTHASETSLDNYSDFDEVIVNDGTLDSLIRVVKILLTKRKII